MPITVGYGTSISSGDCVSESTAQVRGQEQAQAQAQARVQLVTADQLLIEDLGKSGLKPDDINAYLATETELAAVGVRPHLYLGNPNIGTPGYVIPYYDIQGTRAPFYRVKLFSPLPKGARYLQPQNSGAWVYFPRQFGGLVQLAIKGKVRTKVNGFPSAILVTEGEKKAAAACKWGFPTAAVGGVWNWRTRTLLLPENTQLVKNRDNNIVAKIESGAVLPPTSDRRAFLAGGLESLIRVVLQNELQVVFVFDTDNPRNQDVEAACAELAFEFRIHGVSTSRIRQLHLPVTEGHKIGLDDFLVVHGPESLDGLIKQVCEAKIAFPVHPNLKALVNKRLATMVDRNEAKELSLMILADMDRHGMRMVERNTGTPYFFDSRSKTLMSVNLMQHHSEPLHETRFGEFLYRTYDLGQADMKPMQWLAAAFTGEEPVSQVEPRSTLALLPGNRLAYQLDDGHFCIVSGDPEMPFRVCENGSDNLLFKADQVEPINHSELAVEVKRQIGWLQSRPKYEEMYWPKSLAQMKFVRDNDPKVMACLAYMSPWLFRWNGAQLPIELMVGEPSSGKSSTYSLRLLVLTGRPALRNQPTDIRDWYASVTSSDGLHCTDNVHLINKEMRQRLSDEMCRVVTEPFPYIEMRKLFTTSENYRLPVRTVFAMTSIQQPFVNADILQRSVIFEVEAVGKDHSSDWAGQCLRSFGGRVGWLAHHLAVLHLFFKKVDQGGWNSNYKSGHRLAHFEQMFKLIGTIIGVPDAEIVQSQLSATAEAQVSEYDWTMEGLRQFHDDYIAEQQKNPKYVFTLQDIAAWSQGHEEYLDNQTIINARRLARYIKSHKYMVERAAGIVEADVKSGNRDAYKFIPIKPHGSS